MKNSKRKRTFSNEKKNQKFKHTEQMEIDCQISDIEHAFTYVENGQSNLPLLLATSLHLMLFLTYC